MLPASREGASLRTLLPRLAGALGDATSAFEILVVDTGNTLDDTSDVCSRFGARHIRQGGTGYGDAVRTGIAQARGRYVLFMDADGSHNPESIPELWRQRREFEIVIGSRYVAGGRSENGPLLIAMSRILCVAFRMVLPSPVKDVSTSFRLYHAPVLRALRLRATGFDILEEILFEALTGSARARVTEVPITFLKRAAGTSKRRLLPLVAAYLTTFLRLRNGIRNT